VIKAIGLTGVLVRLRRAFCRGDQLASADELTAGEPGPSVAHDPGSGHTLIVSATELCAGRGANGSHENFEELLSATASGATSTHGLPDSRARRSPHIQHDVVDAPRADAPVLRKLSLPWLSAILVFAVTVTAGSRLAVLSADRHALQARRAAQIAVNRSGQALQAQLERLAHSATVRSIRHPDQTRRWRRALRANWPLPTPVGTSPLRPQSWLKRCASGVNG